MALSMAPRHLAGNWESQTHTHSSLVPYPTYTMPKVSVIIPALNEAESLPGVLPRIPSWIHEVLLVDGHSTDDTIAVARRLRPDIRVVMQEGRGKGAALRAGVTAATGDIVVMLDADGSTDPAEIPAFVETLLAGADFAKGSRFLKGAGTDDMPLHRRLGNGVFVVLANVLFGSKYSDITYGYNAVWRKHQDAMALEIDGWANEIIGNIRVARHGLNVVEVPSFEQPRLAGEAKLKTWSAGWTILKAMVAERFHPLPRIGSKVRSMELEPMMPMEPVGAEA
jgi:glycosyltransferase involved in cell wall biosynthesis